MKCPNCKAPMEPPDLNDLYLEGISVWDSAKYMGYECTKCEIVVLKRIKKDD